MAWPRFSCTAGRALWWTLGRRLPLMQSQPRASISEESSRRDWELLRRLCLHEQRNCRAWKSKTRETDRKSTRLNSSHVEISYAVFCLKKKKKKKKKQKKYKK